MKLVDGVNLRRRFAFLLGTHRKENDAMRRIAVIVSSLVIAAPLLSLGTGRFAQADTNDFMGQAKQFMNNRGDDRDSYDRGRDDETRRQQAQRDRSYDRDYNRRDYDRDRARDDRYRQPDDGYSRR
jgi:hypothetical protein